MLRTVPNDFVAFEKPARPAVDFIGENIVFAAKVGSETAILRYSASLDQVLVLSSPLIDSQPELTARHRFIGSPIPISVENEFERVIFLVCSNFILVRFRIPKD